ncbi:putative ABC transporter ATP-binding protein YxlF [Caloramator mitchellensis]|uniref:Putative ABC transporter ATP-binding protein YxlF n=1 Tax=Caloramator mitchellensis TaxID=908809 RepID=A0A0R3JUL5_CALMK|nr:ABC transporter ATP-binding protein [Caloramator mitchellensis]KRQ87259.1 putative ABC transporter ATP-binding protein YxlF [Caloramator mitchellensis]
MIEINNLSKTYAKGKVKAVNNLNLSVKQGEIFGFLGPNGAGKTTTIKMITGILRPDDGRIRINGIDVVKEPIRAKMHIGFVPDNPEIFNRLTGMEYLNFIADIYDIDNQQRYDKINELAESFEIKDALNSSIGSYSHGMKQKLIIIGALIHNPSVWILDEPLVGLDPKAAFVLKDMMRRHANEGNTVFFSTHIMEVAEKVCDRIGIIKKGEIIFTGTIDELRQASKEEESLENLFLELVENE